jgi:hypothetical protein
VKSRLCRLLRRASSCAWVARCDARGQPVAVRSDAARLCPACGLPIGGEGITAFAASSNDGRIHGVFAICARCTNEGWRLPAAVRVKRASRAGDRALADPERYLCTTLPNIGLARIAVGMLRHGAHVQDALNSLGWGDGMGRPI